MEKYLTGSEIREIRRALGVSQIKFASDLGISAPYLSDVERGIKNPSQQLINLILTKSQATVNEPPAGEAEKWKGKYYELLEKHQKTMEELMKLKEPWDRKERRVAGLPPVHGAE